MRKRLAYGGSGLDIDVDPAVTTVVEPVRHEAARDQAAALTAALRHPVAGPPLRERIRPGQTVAISICDGTRPQPRHRMVPAVLAEMEGIVRLAAVPGLRDVLAAAGFDASSVEVAAFRSGA